MALGEASKGAGGLKYVLAGMVLLAGAVGMYMVVSQGMEPPPSSEAPVPEDEPSAARATRSTQLAQQDFILEEQAVEDQPAAQAEADKAPKRPKKVARRGAWECSGDLPAQNVRQLVGQHRAQVRSCYERRLKVNNVLQGDMRLRVKVGAKGQVVATDVGGSLRDAEVYSCVRDIAKSWSFPKPSGGSCAIVQVPFNFAPRTN